MPTTEQTSNATQAGRPTGYLVTFTCPTCGSEHPLLRLYASPGQAALGMTQMGQNLETQVRSVAYCVANALLGGRDLALLGLAPWPVDGTNPPVEGRHEDRD
jgi:hypothetical protein